MENNLGNYLKTKREMAGLSQVDVSRKFGYSSPQFISNWERGISRPPAECFKLLVKIYALNPTEFYELFLHDSLQRTTESVRRDFAKELRI